MYRSIQIYRYNSCPSAGEIRKELKGEKIMIKDVPDKTKEDTMISLKTKFSEPKSFQEGLTGTITHSFQQKITHGQDQYVVVNPQISFFVIPKYDVIVLHGPKPVRTKVLKIIVEALNTDSLGSIEEIYLQKDRLSNFADKILSEHVDNKFNQPTHMHDSLSDDRGIERWTYKMHKGKCATELSNFKKDLEKSSSLDCRLELVKCSGLVDETTYPSMYLNIKHNMEFGSSKSITSQDWNRFVSERCRAFYTNN